MQKGFKIFGLYFSHSYVVTLQMTLKQSRHIVTFLHCNTPTFGLIMLTILPLILSVIYKTVGWCWIQDSLMQCNLPESYFLSLIAHFTHLIFLKSKMNNHLFLFGLLILATHFFICYNDRERTSDHLVMLLYILLKNAIFQHKIYNIPA